MSTSRGRCAEPGRGTDGRPPAITWPLLLACLAATAPATAQTATDALQSGVRVQVFVDQRRNAAAREQQMGYRLRAGAQALELLPESDALMQQWKGDAVLGQGPRVALQRDAKAAPVFLVLDVSNETNRPIQATRSYLQVEASATELQPFVALSAWSESLQLSNHGWGPAENARLSFAFGPERPATASIALALGALGVVTVDTGSALTAQLPALPQLREQPPKCPSMDQVRDCLAQLQGSPAMGRIGDIGFVRRNQVLTRLIGTLSYQWRDAAGAVHSREHALNVEQRLFSFDIGERPTASVGAPGREEEGFAPVSLQLERKSYQLPLPYRPLLAPGQNQRFQLTLDAAKASRHQFRVVMETSDGHRVTTPLLDLLYFVPKMELEPARQVR
jgi:hypothetical protein